MLCPSQCSVHPWGMLSTQSQKAPGQPYPALTGMERRVMPRGVGQSVWVHHIYLFRNMFIQTHIPTLHHKHTLRHTQENVCVCSRMHSQTFTNAHIYRYSHTALPPRSPMGPWPTCGIVGKWPQGDWIGWGLVLQVSHTKVGWSGL